MFRVTRLPGAPPRRAGRAWLEGETITDLDAAELAVLSKAVGYTVEQHVTKAPEKPVAPASTQPPKATRGRPRKRPASI